MKSLSSTVAVVGSSAFLAASAGATVATGTGDTCSATGNGTSYRLTINVPVDAPAQGGFAFGAAGVTVRKAAIPAQKGRFESANLPANATGAWILSGPVLTGPVTVNVTTSGPVTGSFTVVASSSPPASYFDPFTCRLASATPVPSSSFTARRTFAYHAATRTWVGSVSVSAPGRLVFSQGLTHNAPAAATPPKPLIRSGGVDVASAGVVTLTLRPTTAGNAALRAGQELKLNLDITFEPRGGKSATRVIDVTLGGDASK